MGERLLKRGFFEAHMAIGTSLESSPPSVSPEPTTQNLLLSGELDLSQQHDTSKRRLVFTEADREDLETIARMAPWYVEPDQR